MKYLQISFFQLHIKEMHTNVDIRGNYERTKPKAKQLTLCAIFATNHCILRRQSISNSNGDIFL